MITPHEYGNIVNILHNQVAEPCPVIKASGPVENHYLYLGNFGKLKLRESLRKPFPKTYQERQYYQERQ